MSPTEARLAVFLANKPVKCATAIYIPTLGPLVSSRVHNFGFSFRGNARWPRRNLIALRYAATVQMDPLDAPSPLYYVLLPDRGLL